MTHQNSNNWMKGVTLVSVSLMLMFCAKGLLAQDAAVEYQTNMDGSMDYGVAEQTYGSACGACDTCNSCGSTYDGVYNGCGFGYGCGFYAGNGCIGGIFSAVGGIAEAALTPVHWLAGLLTCGTYGDCGCAPLPYRIYCDPCDNCGNWIGGGECATCGGPNGIGYNNASLYGKNDLMGRSPSSRFLAGQEVQMIPQQNYQFTQQPIQNQPQTVVAAADNYNTPAQLVTVNQSNNGNRQANNQVRRSNQPNRMRSRVARTANWQANNPNLR